MNKAKSTKDPSAKETNAVNQKLQSASSRIAKAMALSAETESKLKEIKKDTESQEGSVLGEDAASKFRKNVASQNEKKDAVSFKSLKNWKRLRKTIFETSSIQVFENEIQKILDESLNPNPENGDEEENYANTGNFAFEDSEFGPTEKDPNGFKSIGPKLSEDMHNLHWPQIGEIADMGKAVFIENISDIVNPGSTFWVKNIVQGQVDNLDFLNAVMMVVSHWDLFHRIFNPAFERHFKHGIYTFKFFKNNNQAYFVIVDDKVPCIQQENGEYVPFGARSNNNAEYWISLLEKAYTKLHMSYENMTSPHLKFVDHFYTLTGLIPEEININSEYLDISLLWELLTNFKKYNLPMACLKDNDQDEDSLQIANGHIYIILDIIDEDGRFIIRLGDPWANAPNLMEDQENNGIYDINYEVFIESFNKLIIVKDFPEVWKGIKFDCEILSSKGGPTPANSFWVENPQYIFDVTSKEEGNVILRLQKYIGIQSLQLESLGSTFGFALISLLTTETRVKTPDFKRILGVVKSGEGENCAIFNFKLGKGRYSLIPFTIEKGETAFFYCEFFFDFRENLIDFASKQNERILEPSIGNTIPALKPRTLKQTLRLSDFEGTLLNAVRDNTMLLIPHTTSKILFKEGVTPKFGNPKTLGRGLSKTNTSVNTSRTGVSSNKRLFDAKLDGQHEYEMTAALFGLGGETGRTLNGQRSATRDITNDEVDYDVLATIEDIVDFEDYGLTDVGLEALLDIIMQTKQIRVLKLAGNKLTDDVVLKLADKLEISHHFELEELDLSRNNLGKQAGDILLGMINNFKNLAKIDVSDNKNLPESLKNKMNFSLSKKTIK